MEGVTGTRWQYFKWLLRQSGYKDDDERRSFRTFPQVLRSNQKAKLQRSLFEKYPFRRESPSSRRLLTWDGKWTSLRDEEASVDPVWPHFNFISKRWLLDWLHAWAETFICTLLPGIPKGEPCLVSLQFLGQEATFILNLALLAVVTCRLAFQDSTTEFPCVNFVRHITRPPASWIGNSQLNSLNLCLATLLLPRSKTHAILPSKRF